MKVMITGASGYIGFPLCYDLIKKTDHIVIGVDNNSREAWVRNCGGDTNSNYAPMISKRYHFIKGDLTDTSFINEILAIHKPDVIIHLASQPSMPYSQINAERALFTQINNLSMCLNLLWGIQHISCKKFIITTTTGIPGQYYDVIPEFETLNMAGSWYHVSRGFDSTNCRLASKQWGQTIIELRTSIVYGTQTQAMREDGYITRFDTDFYFGTVLNRFMKQALDKKPITIYGKGEQMKPFIALEDCVASLINAIKYEIPEGSHKIFNQVTGCVSILGLAESIKKVLPVEITHIPNPRKEKEDFNMVFENDGFLKLLSKEPVKIENEIMRMIGSFLKQNKNPPSYTQG